MEQCHVKDHECEIHPSSSTRAFISVRSGQGTAYLVLFPPVLGYPGLSKSSLNSPHRADEHYSLANGQIYLQIKKCPSDIV